MQILFLHLAVLCDLSVMADGAIGRQHLWFSGAVAATSETVFYKLLLESDRVYSVARLTMVSPLQTVSNASAVSPDVID